jgi:hypothetical protein
VFPVFKGVKASSFTMFTKGFQVSTIFSRWFRKGKSRIERRLDKRKNTFDSGWPVFRASNIHYDVSGRLHAITIGGIGAIHLLAQQVGLIEGIDVNLHLLKIHVPYHESDHVLNIAYNALCDGTCLEDIELRRNDENYLNALDALRIPDPTTAGDFCRRFTSGTIRILMDVINNARLCVWARQPDAFFDRATLDMDGTHAVTTGECKEGMDIDYSNNWGYHPLLLTLAETGEVLSIVNRSGNRPSHEGAAQEVDRALLLCVQAGFRKIVLRGDTDFSQTQRLDGWDNDPKIRFFFGYNRTPNLVKIVENLPPSVWRPLERPARYQVKTQPRRRPANVKERVIKEREFKNLRLVSEDVTVFDYQPVACGKNYRIVVVRKNISVEKGEQVLFPDERYFFYITNERECTADEVVFEANDRCNQENTIAQLKSGVPALHAPVDNLESNWAYMVMMALAWNLKAWWALMLPEDPGRWQQKHRDEKRWVLKLEFKTFLNKFMLLPCQIIKTGRKLVYRLLRWNPHLPIFFRLLGALRC